MGKSSGEFNRLANRARDFGHLEIHELRSLFIQRRQRVGLWPTLTATAAFVYENGPDLALRSFRAREDNSKRARQAQLLDEYFPKAPIGSGFQLQTLMDMRSSISRAGPASAEIQRALNYLLESSRRAEARQDIFPRIDIAIPAYQNLHDLLPCLISIFNDAERITPHVIVIDDNSQMPLLDRIANLPLIRVLENSENVGFVHTANRGLALAESEIVGLLNQDTLIVPGSLTALYSELVREGSPDSIVGPLILSPAFRIQEAGGELDGNGRPAHRGRDASLEDWRWNYTTTVDYVSGCALFSKLETLQKLDFLDQEFSPGYYDDTDLCARAWRFGTEVKVVSSAGVVHFEGTSMGTDPSEAASLKRYQHVNSSKFVKRHEAFARAGGHRGLSNQKGHVVFVGNELPTVDRDGGGLDSFAFVTYALELGHKVTYLYLNGHANTSSHEWRNSGVQCASLDEVWDSLAHSVTDSGTILTLGLEAGLAVKDRMHRSGALNWVHFTGDVATRRLESMLGVVQGAASMTIPEARRWYTGLPLEPDQMWRRERPLFTDPDQVLFVTQEDMDFVETRIPRHRGTVFPILRRQHPTRQHSSESNSRTIAFVGAMTHAPNVDAIEHFVFETLPRLRRGGLEFEFEIWGSGIDDYLKTRWSISGVNVKGWFADWDQVAQSASMTIAPLRYGAGLKGKTLSSLLAGIPVVGTELAFEGLALESLEVGCYQTLEELSDLLHQLVGDSGAQSALLERQLDSIGERYSPLAEVRRVGSVLGSGV